VTGDTPQEILGRTDRVVGRVKQLIDSAAGQSVFGSVKRMEPARARAIVEIIGPALRALLADDAHLKIVTFDDSETALSLAGTEGGKEITAVGPVTADQVFHRSAFPLWFDPVGVESPEEIVSSLRTQIAGGSGAGQLPPRVFLVKGLGMFAAGDDFKAADAVRLTYDAAIRMMSFAKRLGGIKPLREEVRRFVEGWEWQTYRKKVSTGVRGEGRAAGKVVVVTGAAQGLGLDVSRDLAAEGAHVALTDVRSGGVMKTCREPGGKFSPEKTLVLEMDVRDARSVAEAIHRVVRTFGGLDLFVSNAGVLKAGSVKTQPEEEFDLVTDVNYKGYFRCVQKVSPIMAIQHMARPAYTSDIIQINSKSGLAGSSRNAAYAGSKFGGIGLTQSFALELLEDGIKVNAVCPGNLFDGPLWSDPVNGLFVQYLRSGKVPGARTVEDVRRAYEAKIPMGRGCTPADVMKAAYYLMEQQYETGQALPVTGGQVMLG
jgi:NAD(P)-dependent dehydrogenase (short-subunit alcohol dehydrogenase family)